MRLLVMRHTDAVDGRDDFKRALSDKGRKQAEKMGDWLKELEAFPDAVAVSPLLRTRETADIVLKRLSDKGKVRPRVDERLACGMTPDDAAGIIQEMGQPDGTLLMVGHAPDLGVLVSSMLGAGADAVEMRKGAVACLDAFRIGRGGARLSWLITPKL